MIHHPAFQSLFLPVLLSVLGIAVLRVGLGARHAAWSGLLGLLGALAWMPGLDWPALARTQKLPWIVCAGLCLAALETWRHRHTISAALSWVAAVLIWAAAAVWLSGGPAGPGATVSAGALGTALVFGAAVLALWVFSADSAHSAHSAHAALPAASPAQGAQPQALTAMVLAMASLGLAGLSATGGSLLLAQLALMLASCVAVVGLWAGLRPASGLRMSTELLLAFGLAWLAIAWCWLLAAPDAGSALGLDSTSAMRVFVLALAFVAPVALQRLPFTRHAARWRVGLTLLLAALAVLVALVWPLMGPGSSGPASLPEPTDDADDPYLPSSGR